VPSDECPWESWAEGVGRVALRREGSHISIDWPVLASRCSEVGGVAGRMHGSFDDPAITLDLFGSPPLVEELAAGTPTR